MKENEFLDGVSNIESDVVERFISMDNKLQNKANKKPKRVWIRFGAVAACLLLCASTILAASMLRNDAHDVIAPSDDTTDDSTQGIVTESETDNPGSDSGPDTTDDNNRPNIPIINVQGLSSSPHYYGSQNSIGMSSDFNMDTNPTGISVTAQFIEMLPDTYTFFDDWNQYEYRLLKMETVKLLRGTEMTEEFYYMIPVAFMTDFSVFDSFVIKDMAQFGYEYSVMYNKTQDKAEQLNIVIFGYGNYGYYLMGENFRAFKSNGDFDASLWNANEAWIEATEHAQVIDNIAQAETIISQENDGWDSNYYVHLLKDISGETADILEQIKSFENGMFIPVFGDKLRDAKFNATKYINGFATNEKVSVWCKKWMGGEQDTYAYTKARFDKEDVSRLPDLSSAFESVKEALNSGSVTPPHFNNQEKLINTTSGVFGWYAKTESGIVGIVRVTWCFRTEKYRFYYDDAYYVVEYGSDECKAIDRDALLDLLGDYEATYIYTGKYNEYGKYSDIAYSWA